LCGLSSAAKLLFCHPDRGAVAQLGERLVRNEEVSGSIPLSSTIYSSKKVLRSPKVRVNSGLSLF
jgi:hypothetical protein